MPFRSRSQIKKLAALEQQGKVKKGTVDKWAAETPNLKSLPERASGAPKKFPKTIQEIKDIKVKKYGK